MQLFLLRRYHYKFHAIEKNTTEKYKILQIFTILLFQPYNLVSISVYVDDIRSAERRPKLLAYCVSWHTACSLCRKYATPLAVVAVVLKEQTIESPDFIFQSCDEVSILSLVVRQYGIFALALKVATGEKAFARCILYCSD